MYMMNHKRGRARRPSDFDKVLRQYKAIYDKFGEVPCPALNGSVVKFNRTGWDHLCNRKWRTKVDRVERMTILPLAKKLISMTTTIQSVRYYEGFQTFEFNAWMDGRRVTAIVSKTKAGFVFLSTFKDDNNQV